MVFETAGVALGIGKSGVVFNKMGNETLLEIWGEINEYN
jgi:hypothetical protein